MTLAYAALMARSGALCSPSWGRSGSLATGCRGRWEPHKSAVFVTRRELVLTPVDTHRRWVFASTSSELNGTADTALLFDVHRLVGWAISERSLPEDNLARNLKHNANTRAPP